MIRFFLSEKRLIVLVQGLISTRRREDKKLIQLTEVALRSGSQKRINVKSKAFLFFSPSPTMKQMFDLTRRQFQPCDCLFTFFHLLLLSSLTVKNIQNFVNFNQMANFGVVNYVSPSSPKFCCKQSVKVVEGWSGIIGVMLVEDLIFVHTIF